MSRDERASGDGRVNGESRPFYDEYAWAYDLVIPPPTDTACDFIADTLARRGVARGSRLLDAGCGTGRYAFELARRGYAVAGVDLSPQLVAEARRRVEAAREQGEPSINVSFNVGDILNLPADESYDAVLCRGVLNDLLDGRSRDAAFRSFARVLRPGGAVLLDVRDWETSARRKIREPVFEKTVETARGALTFQSVTRVDPGTRRLLVEERHTLREGGVERASCYDFQMRCWTREELEARMARAGFEAFEFFGAYERAAAAGATDRLVCAATLESPSNKIM
ncbi:MAG TPA: class I SAM-dependent methyltransferase [Pyrinomonadaceae bacterium]|nr:class I SAM-dependent methyltransferase [Pyrinomonadaceae bacterium]